MARCAWRRFKRTGDVQHACLNRDGAIDDQRSGGTGKAFAAALPPVGEVVLSSLPKLGMPAMLVASFASSMIVMVGCRKRSARSSPFIKPSGENVSVVASARAPLSPARRFSSRTLSASTSAISKAVPSRPMKRRLCSAAISTTLMRNHHLSAAAMTSNTTSANSTYGHRRRRAAADCAVFMIYIKREAQPLASRASNKCLISKVSVVSPAGSDRPFGHHADQVCAVFCTGVNVLIQTIC